MCFVICDAVEDDLCQIELLDRQSFQEHEAWSVEGYRYEFESRSSFLRVAVLLRASVRIIGAACFRIVCDEGYLMKLFADRAYRRCGVGTMLIHSVFEECSLHGVRRIVLDVARDNVAARAFYEHSGFFYSGHSGRRDGSFVMERDLP